MSEPTHVSPDELLERHRKVLPAWVALYYDRPIELVRGKGSTVWDSEGNEYLDLFGGIVTTISGHAVESLVEALRDQAERIAHTSTLYLIEPMVRLAERLVELAPVARPAKAFFVGSGTEAVEAALLMATSARRSNQVLALRNSYHGRSFAAVGVTGNRAWGPTSFSPLNVSYALAPYCYRCPLRLEYPSCGVACADDVRAVIETTTSGDVAAMIAEPIQGVGGFVTPPREYFTKVKAILDEYGIPLIIDEVQTGFGRTGEAFWGAEAYDVTPDLITCAKGLGNGMAIGAVVGRADLVDAIAANSISTFGGNPIATTVALANLDYLEEEGLQANAQRVGKLLLEGLDDLRDRHEVVGDVRGKGLMLGVELVEDKASKTPSPAVAAAVMEACRRRGVLVGKGGLYGSVLRLSPPLVLTEDEARRGVRVLDEALADATGGGGHVKTLIANGTVVTAAEMVLADVLIEGERIRAVGTGLGEADRVIDATGRYVMPGGIDVHTHMELPFGGTFASDDFATGTRAAAFGGTTTIVDFAVQSFGESLSQGLDTWLEKASPKSHLDFGLHLIVREINPSILAEMDAMIARGVTSFKLFMAYPGVFMLDDASIFRAMSKTAENGGLIMLHAENGGAIDVLVQRYLAEGKTAPINHGLTRPASMEGEATHRAIALAELAEVPVYIVHLSAKEALDAVREGRDRGVHAYAETCPQYLYLTLEDMGRPGFEGAKFVCSPPLRPREHQAELWKGLILDDLQVVSTDHCPFDYKEQKSLGRDDFSAIPNGLPGVEDRYTLLWDGGVATGQITPMRFVELIATAPARMFGLHPTKGTIAAGSDADVVVFDPTVRRTISSSTHHMRVDYSCYEGREVTGLPEVVLQRGKVLVEGGEFFGKPGDGRFLERRPFSAPGVRP